MSHPGWMKAHKSMPGRLRGFNPAGQFGLTASDKPSRIHAYAWIISIIIARNGNNVRVYFALLSGYRCGIQSAIQHHHCVLDPHWNRRQQFICARTTHAQTIIESKQCPMTGALQIPAVARQQTAWLPVQFDAHMRTGVAPGNDRSIGLTHQDNRSGRIQSRKHRRSGGHRRSRAERAHSNPPTLIGAPYQRRTNHSASAMAPYSTRPIPHSRVIAANTNAVSAAEDANMMM